MKIAHVVNLVDELGTYGGPLRVAVNQLEELGKRGHDATLLGGTPPAEAMRNRNTTRAFRTMLFASRQVLPGTGFAGRWAPGLHSHLIRSGRTYDVVHVHLARDLTTLPAVMILCALDVPYIVQTHGMIDPSTSRLARPLDTIMTRRALRGARAVMVLTDHDRLGLEAVLGTGSLVYRELPNGVSGRQVAPDLPSGKPEVLFLSRLHARKRPQLFVTAAVAVAGRGVDARFTLIGPDEGMLSDVQLALSQLPDTVEIVYDGVAAPDTSVDRIAQASLLVLPSIDEPFPMVILEAMSVARPVICTRSCGLAPAVEQARAGIVVDDDDPRQLADAIERLVKDQDFARKAGLAGYDLVRNRFNIASVAETLEGIYGAHARMHPPGTTNTRN